MAELDDFYATERLTENRSGLELIREIGVRAEDAAAARVHADAPKRYDTAVVGSITLYADEISIEQQENFAYADGGFYFVVQATYRTLQNPRTAGQPNKARWTITSAARPVVHRVSRYPQLHFPPDADYQGEAINVTENGIEGIQAEESIEVLRLDLWKYSTSVGTYLDTIRPLRDKVNSDVFSGPWGTYQPGEARLKSYSLSHVDGEVDQVTLEIELILNETESIVLLGGAEEVTKEGHQPVWIRTRKFTDPADDTKTQEEALDAHVPTVYQTGLFADLGVSEGLFV